MLKALTTLALLALPGTALAADLVSDPPTDARTNMLADPAWAAFAPVSGEGTVTESLSTGHTAANAGVRFNF